MEFSTITSWTRLIRDALDTYGIDGNGVYRQVGLDPAALDDANARYPVAAIRRLWKLAAELSGDSCFGLTAAEQWHPTSWHGLGYAWLASATLEEAFRRLVRYSGLISTSANIALEERGGVLRLTASTVPGAGLEDWPVLVDASAATIVHMCRVACGRDFDPDGVELPHEGRGCRRRRQEFFRAPILYGAREIAILVNAGRARRPLPSANAELAHANERVIADYLAALGGGSTSVRVRRQLIDDLPSGDVTEEGVARALHMSRRTLQRKLGDEGTTYAAVLQDVRRELAESFIRDDSLTLSEITYLLGFSEVSSFSRSFKRWTGLPPTAYRRRQAAG
jgi:AraC-like DNA-binding protein